MQCTWPKPLSVWMTLVWISHNKEKRRFSRQRYYSVCVFVCLLFRLLWTPRGLLAWKVRHMEAWISTVVFTAYVWIRISIQTSSEVFKGILWLSPLITCWFSSSRGICAQELDLLQRNINGNLCSSCAPNTFPSLLGNVKVWNSYFFLGQRWTTR